MVKFDVQAIRFLDSQHFRVLTAVEMGMKNHELVPLPLISSIAAIHRGATARTLNDLTRSRLVAYESGKKFDGYRLTTLGYDFLALRALCSRNVVGYVGNQIGVGKESDIYVAGDPELKDLVLKFHRLGRTSFRKLKEKRDYHRSRHYCSWLYLSRLAAIKEFAFLQALHAHHFPVPRPVDISRHTVVMELITGPTLSHVSNLDDAAALYDKLMKLIVRLGSYGLIHGDFNEFNVMLLEDESPILIDFPQMVSIDHANAEFYFNRDVQCVRTFFQRRFHFDGEHWPQFGDVQRRHNLDIELEASGFTKQMRRDLNKAYDEGNFTYHLETNESQSSSNDDEEEEELKADTVNFGNQKEANDGQDREEMDDIAQEGKEARQQLCGSSRFQSWLDQTRDELEALTVEEGQMTGEQLHDALLGPQREAKAAEVIDIGRAKSRDAIDEEEEEKQDDQASNNEEDSEMKEEKEGEASGKRKKVHRRRNQQQQLRGGHGIAESVASAGSTIIPPEEVKRRLLMERGQAKKEKLRVKGQQNAVRRGRQQNQELIREYAEIGRAHV